MFTFLLTRRFGNLNLKLGLGLIIITKQGKFKSEIKGNRNETLFENNLKEKTKLFFILYLFCGQLIIFS